MKVRSLYVVRRVELASGIRWDHHTGNAECGTSTVPRPWLPPEMDTPGTTPRPTAPLLFLFMILFMFTTQFDDFFNLFIDLGVELGEDWHDISEDYVASMASTDLLHDLEAANFASLQMWPHELPHAQPGGKVPHDHFSSLSMPMQRNHRFPWAWVRSG